MPAAPGCAAPHRAAPRLRTSPHHIDTAPHSTALSCNARHCSAVPRLCRGCEVGLILAPQARGNDTSGRVSVDDPRLRASSAPPAGQQSSLPCSDSICPDPEPAQGFFVRALWLSGQGSSSSPTLAAFAACAALGQVRRGGGYDDLCALRTWAMHHTACPAVLRPHWLLHA